MKQSKRSSSWCIPRLVILSLVGAVAVAQNSPAEHSFAASKANVEKALREIHAYSGGKLPLLDGFVDTADSLEGYTRGFYQYSIEVIATSPTESRVRATAKVTAWYSDRDNSRSGYRVLPSNGRLESDLFERLEEALKPAAAKSSEDRAPAAHSGTSLPDSPSAAGSSTVFSSSRSASPAMPTREQASAVKQPESEADRKIEQLARRARELEVVVRNQSRPNNLAIVKSSQTAVYARPLEGTDVVLTADAEDEFQIVDLTGTWVHVQISGISRGWIPRSKVTLPGDTVQSAPPTAASDSSRDKNAGQFQSTREELSMFPGNWAPLRGKTVKIVWVEGSRNDAAGDDDRITFARNLFRKEYTKVAQGPAPPAGVVIVFDAEDGGMAAATMASLQQWQAGHLSDSAFWKQCWLDPVDAFKNKN